MSTRPYTILGTGFTGTFGNAFTRYILDSSPDAIIRVYAREERAHQRMMQRFNYPAQHEGRLTFIIGDVRDADKVKRAAWRCDAIVHAAALKQVTFLEANPDEAVKTNVDGTLNVIEAALEAGVRANLLISSDKSPHPENLYGMTKAVAEKLWLNASAYTGGRGVMNFAVVRYGNVLGSRGSVVGVWRDQLKRTGKLTITDPDATRFIITPGQAARAAWHALGRSGVVVIPRLPSCTVRDLAMAVAPKAEWDIVGLKIGEKAHEEMATAEEMSRAVEVEGYFHVTGAYTGKRGAYMSDKSEGRLGARELREMIEQVDRTGLLEV